MIMKSRKRLFVGLALGLAVLVYLYSSLQTSKPVRVIPKQSVKTHRSHGVMRGASTASSPSTALSTGKPYPLLTGGQPPDSNLKQPEQTEAAISGGQHLNADSNDYYGEALFENLDLAVSDPDSEVRREAAENSIAFRNDAALEVFIAALQDREALNRVAAIDSLGRLLSEGAADEEQIFGLLLEATDDPDPDVANAAMLLVQDRFQSPTQSELELTADAEPPETDLEQDLTEATTPGGQYLDSDADDDYKEKVIEDFKVALIDSDPEVRREMAENAVALRNDAGFEVLIDALQDREAQNRVAAIDSLGRLLSEGAADEEQVLGLLLEAADDLDPDVAQRADLLIQDRFSSQTSLPAE